MFVKLCRWFFQQLVLVFDFYHRLGLKNREVTQLLTRSRSVLCRMSSLASRLTVCAHPVASAMTGHYYLLQVRLHNLMLASDSPRSALKISDFEYSKTEQVRCPDHAFTSS